MKSNGDPVNGRYETRILMDLSVNSKGVGRTCASQPNRFYQHYRVTQTMTLVVSGSVHTKDSAWLASVALFTSDLSASIHCAAAAAADNAQLRP